MHKILILIVLLCSATKVLSFSDLAETNNNNEPVANILKRFAEDTASAIKKLLDELSKDIESTFQTLVSDMEMVMTSALHQFAQPFEDLQNKLSASECKPKVELEQLKQQVSSELSKCTQTVQEIINNFQQDSDEFKMAVEKNINEIIDFPNKCKNLESGAGFTKKISCYLETIADANQQASNILNDASETIMHTRRLGEKALQEGHLCTNEVITTTIDSFNKTLSTCSEILEQ